MADSTKAIAQGNVQPCVLRERKGLWKSGVLGLVSQGDQEWLLEGKDIRPASAEQTLPNQAQSWGH